MILAKDLRMSLLQKAFEGKITERNNNDSNVKEYLSCVDKKRKEYEEKYKEKKHIKLSEVKDFETHFDIPDEWEWVYLGDIFRHNAGKALNAKNTTGTKRKYITTSNVYGDHLELSSLKEMYYTDDEVEKYSVKKGDLIVLEGGDCGRTAIWDLDESYCIQNHLHRLRPFCKISIKFYFYLLSFYKEAGYTKGKGIAIQGLSANALHCLIVPLPSVEEQERIVAKVDELMAKIDEYEKIEKEITVLESNISTSMKESILQAAMQGKLTEQLNTDSDVNDLVDKIKNNQELLLKNKTIKVGKYSKEIPDNLLPIPSNWKYIKIGDISSLVTKQTGFDYSNTIKPSLLEIKTKDSIPYIQTRDFTDEIFNFDTKFYVPKDVVDSYPNITLDKRCLLLSIVGSIGNVGLYNGEIKAFLGGAITKIDLLDERLYKFIYYYLKSPQGTKEISKNLKKTAQATVTVEDIRNISIPLPPIEEQQRIVDKLDKLLPLCEGLLKEEK